MSQTKNAVVLLSGGLDSAVTMAVAKKQGFDCYALSFRYGQRHAIELESARRVAQSIGAARHLTVDVDIGKFGGSALTDRIDVPHGRSTKEMEQGIPSTYVPARNTVFLSMALAWAEVLGCFDIFIGVNAIDFSGYPDCRPEYVVAFEKMANLATKAAVESGRRFTIHAPLSDLTKARIVELGHQLKVDFSLTHSCYDPDQDGRACGTCDACQLRLKGFAENGLQDPARYRRLQSSVQ